MWPVLTTSSPSTPIFHNGALMISHGPKGPVDDRDTHSQCPDSVPPSAVNR